MDKRELILGMIDEQKKIIRNKENTVSRYKIASDLDENDSIDPEDFSHQGEAKDMQLRFEQMLNEAKLNLEKLQSYLDKNSITIEPGSMIETTNFILFIGVSIPLFIMNGKNVITMSEQAPIYKSIKDYKVGDLITIGNQQGEIVTIS